MTGEYSYRSRHCAADGLVLVGDAFAFLDPVFSSGVFLALRSGELRRTPSMRRSRPAMSPPRRFAEYGDRLPRHRSHAASWSTLSTTTRSASEHSSTSIRSLAGDLTIA